MSAVVERESWSRSKNINLSPLPSPPHFSTAARSLHECLGEIMQQGVV